MESNDPSRRSHELPLTEYIAVISTVISLTSLAVVLIELRQNRKQSRSNALIQIYDINRQLLGMGFSHPQLFELIGGDDSGEAQYGRRYFQLWLNQMALIYQLHQSGHFPAEQWDSLRAEMTDFMAVPQMRDHWKTYGAYYPANFQAFIGTLITDTKKAGASTDAPPEENAA